MSVGRKVWGLTKRKPILLVSVSLLPAFYCCFWVSIFSFVQKFWHKCFLCFIFLSQKIFNYIFFHTALSVLLKFFFADFYFCIFFVQIFLGTLSYFNLKIYFPGEKNPATGKVLRVYYRFCKNENR